MGVELNLPQASQDAIDQDILYFTNVPSAVGLLSQHLTYQWKKHHIKRNNNGDFHSP